MNVITTPDPRHLFAPHEAARILKVSRQRVSQLMDRGQLVTVTTPLGRLISPASLAARLANQSTPRSRHSHG